MNLQDVQQMAWQAVSAVPWNPDAGLVKTWLERKQGYTGPLGVPIAAEQAVDEGGVAQPFSSGCVLWWTGSAVEAL
jgi:uncharacterized protein with LGFP repeats